jgi:CDP-Glycerol:Poly(glycerophosphate) glycerophosphotransferase
VWNEIYPLRRGVFADDPKDLEGRQNPVIVAGYRDMRWAKPRPVIFIEHGAGQTYGGRTPAHPGGRNRDNVALFICPSGRVVGMNKARYPHIPAIAVGSPVMDRFHRYPSKPERGTVAVAFHWNALTAPESRTAFPHFADAIVELAKERTVIGHGHPRIARMLRRFYAMHGITWVALEDVYRRAEVLVVDNSSVGWEFLSLDRPVVWLNAPWYRRGVEYGLRFWEYADSGVQVDDPADLSFGVAEALLDRNRARRREVVPEVYAYTDGRASERAARAIEEWHDASLPQVRGRAVAGEHRSQLPRVQ